MTMSSQYPKDFEVRGSSLLSWQHRRTKLIKENKQALQTGTKTSGLNFSENNFVIRGARLIMKNTLWHKRRKNDLIIQTIWTPWLF